MNENIDTTQINGDLSVGRDVAIGGDLTVQGNAEINHNLKVKGWLDAPNIMGADKGIFETAADLNAAYPLPQTGWYAGVGTTEPFALYIAQDGAWVATGGYIDEGSHFWGYAPLNNPTPTPTSKGWYITDPRLVIISSKTYTGYGNDFTVTVGNQYIVWWNGTQWRWTHIESDFQNANYGSNGRVRINVPSTQTPYTPSDPRGFDVLADEEDMEHVANMWVDEVEVTPTDHLLLPDSDAHVVSVYHDNQYGSGTPTCYDGVEAETITLPYGVTEYDHPVGITTTSVVLPPTVTYIDADAITATGAQTLVLMGAPPTLDGEIDWSNIVALSIPAQYQMLYSNSAAWREAIEDVIDGGGTVTLDNGSDYTDAREQIDVVLSSQTVFPSDTWVVTSDKTAKEVCEAVEAGKSVNALFSAGTLTPDKMVSLVLTEMYHKHYDEGKHIYEIVENEPPNVTVMDNLVVIRQVGDSDNIRVTIKDVESFSYNLYNSNSQAVDKGDFNSNTGTIDFSNLQEDDYRLQLVEPKGTEKNYDITKNEALSNDIDEYSVLYKGKCQYDSDSYDEELLAVDHFFSHEEVYYDGELDTSDIEHFTVTQEQADWNETNNKKPGYIKNKPTLAAVATSGDFDDLTNVPLGEANGIAELDSNGRVPSSQLPSYVDDVIEGYLYNDHWYTDASHTTLSPSDREDGKIYVELSTNLSYRWSGSVYVEVSPSLALGETSSTAYRGDRGKTAYDHATDASRLITAQSSALYKIAVTAEGHVSSVTAVTASDIPTQDATTSQKGVVELATDAETKAGTDTERVITPHGLASVLPMPTAADADKLLSVNSSGEYELITIINSELIPY